MTTYPKIQTVFLRDPEVNYKTLLEGTYAKPEFAYLKNNTWVFTEKVDGTNIRVIWNEDEVTLKGKTDKAVIPKFLRKKLEELFLEESELFEEVFGDEGGVCMYGEGYGARIQGGGGNYNPKGQNFVLFDVRIGKWWLTREAIEKIAGQFEIGVVPIMGEGLLEEAVEMTREGFNSSWGDFIAEGLVMKPKVALINRAGERVIAKIKHKDF